MKRGRPAMRQQFRQQILEALGEVRYPATVTTVRRRIQNRTDRSCGYDTVHKYLEELVSERLVLRQALPVRARRKPLVLYLGRSGPDTYQE